MKKIVLTGTDETKETLIDTIKSIGDPSMKVLVKNFQMELELVSNEDISDADNIMVNWKGSGSITNKLAFIKAIKLSLNTGLKETKDLLDYHIIPNFQEAKEYPIDTFIFEVLKSDMNIDDFYTEYKENQDTFEQAFEIVF